MEEQKPEEPILVDVRGAGRLLGLGRSSVLNLADAGELPKLRFGRRVVYAVSDIEALVERRRAAAAGAGIYRLSPPDQQQ